MGTTASVHSKEAEKNQNIEEVEEVQKDAESDSTAGDLTSLDEPKNDCTTGDVTSLGEAKKQLIEARRQLAETKKQLEEATEKIKSINIRRSSAYEEMYNTSATTLTDSVKVEEELDMFLKQHGKVADSFWLQHSQACKECLGPISMERDLNKSSTLKARQALEINQKIGKFDQISMQKLNLEKLAAQKKKLVSKMSRAVDNLSNTRVAVASEVSHQLVADATRYSHAMRESVLEDPKTYAKLNETAAAITNVSSLKVGAEVEVVNAGSLTKACVVEVKSGGTYKVSLWKKLEYIDTAYEEGYYTREAEHLELPRTKLYALHEGKIRQTLSDATISLICQGSDEKQEIKTFLRNTKRPEFLMALYVEARGARICLQMLGDEACTAIDKSGSDLVSIIPNLKNKERATVKAQEKYGGDYSCLTDLARMTFECATIAVALTVLTFIHEHADWKIFRIKNRLDKAYDASPTGGYRDMLINAMHRDHRHCVEIQVTLVSLLKIKKSGGHAVYKLARLLELNEKVTTVFNGQPTAKTVADIAAGLVREVAIKSVPLEPKLRDALFSDQGLLSPNSAMMSLEFDAITSFNGWTTARAVSPTLMQHIGINLKVLSFCECGLRGPFPETIGVCCPNLEHIDFCRNTSITGDIPKKFWSLSKMRTIYLENLGLTGSIPEGISQMKYLQELYLGGNKLTGPLPQAMGLLKSLVKCSLQNNHISGLIPSTIGACTKLQHLMLQNNPLEGRLPASLSACTQLYCLFIHGTKMDLQGYPMAPEYLIGTWQGSAQISALFAYLKVIKTTHQRRQRKPVM